VVRIAFVIPSLGPGGAERVASLLANDWVGNGHEVTLATFDTPGTEPFFALDPRVDVRELSVAEVSRDLTIRVGKNAKRVTRFRALLREVRPDAVVAFMTEASVVAVWATIGLGIPVVISERNQPDRPGLRTFHKLLRRLSYPLASAIVVQTEEIAAWARARFRVPVRVIPNPVMHAPDARPRKPDDVHYLVSIGRLTHQKGFDVLLQGFGLLAAKHPDWKLVIYGEGPDRSSLEELRLKSRCSKQISLPGLTKDSMQALRQADLFVLPSRFEGYPNVLLEALACGLPVVATACPGATAEILANGVHGMLVPPNDVGAMTTALDAMLSSPKLRDAYAGKALRAVVKLDLATIGCRWLDLLAGLRVDAT
jgi:glycosyltransferase involved in cell wall biosynthesis